MADALHIVEAAQAAPLHHFSGELIAKDAGATLGLHALALRLEGEDGLQHVVFIHHGRGQEAGDRCIAQWRNLTIGQRYHGSATRHVAGPLEQHWMGTVTLQACQRRPRFQLVREVVA